MRDNLIKYILAGLSGLGLSRYGYGKLAEIQRERAEELNQKTKNELIKSPEKKYKYLYLDIPNSLNDSKKLESIIKLDTIKYKI